LPDDIGLPDGLILDLDGTLVDTVDARITGWLEALRDAGILVTREEIAPMIGMDGRRLAREAAALRGRAVSEEEAEAVDRDAGAAFDRHNSAPRPLPGADEVFATAESFRLPWVIATSSRAEQVVASVQALGLGAAPRIVDGSHVRHAKPAPDLLLLAASRLGLSPGRCWAIGDSSWDMRAAVAAGMPAIGVTAGSAVDEAALTEAGATLVVETLGQLATHLRVRFGEAPGG